MNRCTILSTIAFVLFLVTGVFADQSRPPQVQMETSKGLVIIELDAKAAPATVANFIAYVKSGLYDGTIFHRVIKNFMIQGGGFSADMKQKSTQPPIKNEADNGLKNDTGTIAMARTSAPHSATSQFFINVKDNHMLNHSSKTPRGWGYCVFGKVIKGMDVVHTIENVPTGIKSGHRDVPVDPIEIKKAVLINPQNPATSN
jgi:peptidyl-prolyl cis-trans isomerase B (cyclophilin B)